MNNLMRWFIVALSVGIQPTSASAQMPRIDPAGIPGTLLICGADKPSEAAFERFIELAGGAKAKIAVVHVNDEQAAKAIRDGLAESAMQKKAAEPKLIPWKDAKAALPDLTGVWLLASHDHRKWQGVLKEHLPREDYLALLKRSGVIATSGHSSDIIGGRGLQLTPVFDVRSRPDDQKKDLVLDGMVAITVKDNATLQIKGRTLSAVGPGTIDIWLSKKNVPVRMAKLEGKRQEDLTAWLRAARDRQESFPPKTVELPVVEKGMLVIVGGGGSPADLHKKFIEYAGGEGKANIVILPTANPDPLPKEFPGFIKMWKKAGAKKVTVLPGRTIAEVEGTEYLEALREATGIWFDGGRQWRFVDAYENTKALPLMFDVLNRGGVIGGTSAGATIQGEYLARGGVFNNFDIHYEGYERGLGFLKGVAIDQHFTQRKRQPEMTSLMKTYPQYLGIGLDEATAIVVKGSVADVIGKGKVYFYDANRKIEKGEADYEALPAGGRYDLKLRKVLSAEK